MKTNNFMEVVKKYNSKKYIENLKQNELVIYSPTSIEKNNIYNNQCLMVNWHDITKNIDKIEEFIKENKNITTVISYGGGSTIDIGKYIAYKLNINFTCIPTMLSTNSYATNKVALIKENKKVTLEAKIPETIIIDDELLNLSKEENIYGLADVFSIYTALYDWKVAQKDINEKIDYNIYNMAEKLLQDVVEFVNNNKFEDIVKNNIKLFEFIGIAGYITNLYGTGRPESGSEHIMAKEIERRINVPHGMSVSIGILIMGLMQNRDILEIVKVIKKLNIFEKVDKYGLNKEIIEKSFIDLKSREDRYSIVNRYENKIEEKQKILKELYSIIDGEIELC
ncbi:MAG: iron-containing alcohol dehydrogenase family protein [Clostridia bacterium]|nr:iron-containing alcohol dehydrogenase family protein [Clostridia bacterium]